MTDEVQTPAELPELTDSFEIAIDGEKREIEMKFGLLRELTRAFPGSSDPQSVFQDQNAFELALTILLIPRNEKGKPLPEADAWDLDDYEMDPSAAIDLVKWAMEHVLRFFLTKLSKVLTLGETNMEQIEALLSSLPGLKASLSKKPSAGPMDFSTLVSEASTGVSPTETSEPT